MIIKSFRFKLIGLLTYFIIFFIPSIILFGIQSLKTWAFCFIITAFMGILNEILQELIDLNSNYKYRKFELRKAEQNRFFNEGYQPVYSNLNPKEPPKGGSGVKNYAKDENN